MPWRVFTIAGEEKGAGGAGGGYEPGGTDVALADGGTGATLSDPNADRIMFWDDSAGAVTWLTAGSGLTLSGTTLTGSGGGGGSGINVLDFGAVGDNVTDDSAAIQAAIDSVDVNRGGDVFFPERIGYKVNTGLTSASPGIHLIGEGSQGQSDGLARGSVRIFVGANQWGFTYNGTGHYAGPRIDNLHFIAQSAAALGGVRLVGVSNTNHYLLCCSNFGGTTTLNGAISDTATSLVVTSAANFPTTGGFMIRIGDENILVGAVAGTTFSSLTRAYKTTTAAAHSNGDRIIHGHGILIDGASNYSQYQTFYDARLGQNMIGVEIIAGSATFNDGIIDAMDNQLGAVPAGTIGILQTGGEVIGKAVRMQGLETGAILMKNEGISFSQSRMENIQTSFDIRALVVGASFIGDGINNSNNPNSASAIAFKIANGATDCIIEPGYITVTGGGISGDLTIGNHRILKPNGERWVGGLLHFFGTGTPEGVIVAPIGSTYMRKDGGATTTLYVKTSGAGNTGWTAK